MDSLTLFFGSVYQYIVLLFDICFYLFFSKRSFIRNNI